MLVFTKSREQCFFLRTRRRYLINGTYLFCSVIFNNLCAELYFFIFKILVSRRFLEFCFLSSLFCRIFSRFFFKFIVPLVKICIVHFGVL